MKSNNPMEKGTTLIELLVILAIAAVLFTVAMAQFGRSGDILKRQNAAREFKVRLERARFDSVKRRATDVTQMSRVTVLSSTSFSYTFDFNQNGQIDFEETRTVDLAARGNVSITGTNFVYPITIRFDERGHTTILNGDSPPTDITPLFYFCDGGCTVATASTHNSNIIYVSPTGTVAMMKGGDTLPTFGAPAVTAVTSTNWVNPLLAVWTLTEGSTSPTPTPTTSPTPIIPTPTPITTPSIPPVPTPSPVTSPSPIGTPIPTPTPLACTYGQKPSLTGCVCTSPMWVRQNGKCQ